MKIEEEGRAFYHEYNGKWYAELAGGEHAEVLNPHALCLGRDENKRVIVAVDPDAPPNPPLRKADFVRFVD